ncbi:MAG: insulinase family protein [Candidatus Poribacteria bacterium]|nr:insulinase family protein [Candidatus Poribacteria bacterium]
MISRIKHAIVVLFVLGNFSLAFAAPPEVTRFTLSNGIKVVNLYVEDSTDVGIFSYLPLGLVADGKAKTQWSHLIEHLVLRTTGPISNYMERNGQTTYHGMHLDFMGTTDNWEQGLELQTKWLSNSPLSETDLVEELPRALSELDFVTNNLHTGLFAMAAWNQVFRHGETDIAMRGAIESAELNELQAYRNRHLVHADRVLLCVIGGIASETLQTAMEEQLGQIKLTANTLPSATTPAAENNRRATWDVNVTHYMETYAIPNATHEHYPAFFVANVLLNQSLMMDSELKQLTGSIFCGVDLITPEQTYLFVTAALKPDSDIEKVQQRIGQLINPLKQPENNWQVAMMAPALSQQFSAPMDIEMVMQQHKPAGMTETMMLGNLGLQWGLLEYQHGDALPTFANALANVSADDVADVVNRYLTEDARMTLVLTPRASE